MAEQLGKDTNDEIIYRVRKLFKRHADVIKEFKAKAPEIRLRKLMLKFPHVNEICKSLKRKYAFSGETYTVLAPSGIQDIVQEGDVLDLQR